MNPLKIFLLPFALLFELITYYRFRFYNMPIGKKRVQFKVPVIVVGNITVGGTGKTPHIEFLGNFLTSKYQTAFLSRGYGRKSKGFIEVSEESTATKVGDEMLQVFTKFKDKATCYVGESRVEAIRKILTQQPSTQLCLLDDAYQHLPLKASTYILLTDYDRLFTKDFVLPMGLLRESRSAGKRADMVIVTKCPSTISEKERDEVSQQISKYTNAPIWFSTMVSSLSEGGDSLAEGADVVCVSGIAQNGQFIDHLSKRFTINESFQYKDHHAFTIDEVTAMVEYCRKHQLPMITTQKDYMRLLQPEFGELIGKIAIFVVQIEVKLLGNEQSFWSTIIDEVEKCHK
ncbi:tetraacyldisaccharide 4'-kinase [Cyclobacteriaceae bacterium]|nr:tetraacyldisaccharide 4'-kinase [Cyclobacteriaceae bacterium]